MTLDTQLAKLQGLEVSSVEGTIGDIERAKLQTDFIKAELEPKIDEEVRKYISLVRQKLPRIIGNIQTLGKQISDLGSFRYGLRERGYGLDTLGIDRYLTEAPYLCLERGDRRYSLKLESQNGATLQFDFGENSDFSVSLGEEFYKEYGFWKRELKGGYGEMQSRYLIQPTTTDLFVERFVELIQPGLLRKGEDRFEALPLLSNQIPYFISEIYEERRKTTEEELQRINSKIRKKNEGLEILKVSRDVI